MKTVQSKTVQIILAAAMIAFVAGSADARRKGGGGSGGTITNYGCSSLKAGSVLRSPDNSTQKTLLTATSTCYICNMTTRVCTVQSPSSLVGWTFVLA